MCLPRPDNAEAADWAGTKWPCGKPASDPIAEIVPHCARSLLAYTRRLGVVHDTSLSHQGGSETYPPFIHPFLSLLSSVPPCATPYTLNACRYRGREEALRDNSIREIMEVQTDEYIRRSDIFVHNLCWSPSHDYCDDELLI